MGAGGAAAGGALIAAATGGSATAVAEPLMDAAIAMVSAAVLLPPALMISFEFRLAKGKPQSLEKAAAQWSKAAEEIQQAANDLQSLAKGVPEQAWNMDDRQGYEGKVDEFRAQVDALSTYLQAVSIALTVLAYALLAYAIFAMGMAVYIDVLLALAVAALASIVGAPSYAAILSAAATGLTVTHVATAILASAGTMAGAVMGGGAGLTAAYQAGHGNDGAGAAFKEAVVNGSAGAAANLLQNAANAGLSWVNRSDGTTINGGLPGGKSAGGKGFPISEIDLDADRNINETWTYGGGVKVNTPAGETEIAGNIKKNEEGWAGGEVGVNQKMNDPTGTYNGTVGGKVTWDENENVGGGFKGGVGDNKSGSKAEYEGGWDGKGDYTDKYNVNSPVFNREGSFDQPKDETPPWDK
ncbi:hypothetical protein FXF68_36785 [Actinomadura decatromicini]|uniref:Uncharacterized protein n=2 Tax=Actinomadura decatromicini TaxID=2604572 RepID=A0A5D3F3W0_9ACTN|nr:hypothetical protein FXF68_36785 [Actinomadura decatromicini]